MRRQTVAQCADFVFKIFADKLLLLLIGHIRIVLNRFSYKCFVKGGAAVGGIKFGALARFFINILCCAHKTAVEAVHIGIDHFGGCLRKNYLVKAFLGRFKGFVICIDNTLIDMIDGYGL